MQLTRQCLTAIVLLYTWWTWDVIYYRICYHNCMFDLWCSNVMVSWKLWNARRLCNASALPGTRCWLCMPCQLQTFTTVKWQGACSDLQCTVAHYCLLSVLSQHDERHFTHCRNFCNLNRQDTTSCPRSAYHNTNSKSSTQYSQSVRLTSTVVVPSHTWTQRLKVKSDFAKLHCEVRVQHADLKPCLILFGKRQPEHSCQIETHTFRSLQVVVVHNSLLPCNVPMQWLAPNRRLWQQQTSRATVQIAAKDPSQRQTPGSSRITSATALNSSKNYQQQRPLTEQDPRKPPVW